MKNSLCSSQVEKAHAKQQQQRPSTAKNKLIKKKNILKNCNLGDTDSGETKRLFRRRKELGV